MSKEQDIHKIIEQQSQDEKAKSLQKLYTRLVDENIDISIAGEVAVAKKPKLNIKNIAIVSIICVLMLTGVLLSVLLPNRIDDSVRYCTSESYYVTVMEQSVSDYANQSNKSIIGFTWDDGAEHVLTQQYRLNDTNEIIGLYEEGIDRNGMILYYYVIKKNIELDLLSNYKTICTETKVINNTEILYVNSLNSAYAMFKVDNYTYFLQIEDVPNQNYVLDVIQELLGTI